MTVGYKLAGLLDKNNGGQLPKRIKGVRQNISESMGVLLPPIALRDDLTLQPPSMPFCCEASHRAKRGVPRQADGHRLGPVVWRARRHPRG